MPIRPFDGPVLQRAEPTCEPSMRPPFVRPRICGAHLQDTLQYTANQTNGNVLTKFKQLPDLWHRLSRSHSPQTQKLKVLRVVAWPRVFYSGSIVHIGSAHFDEARAGACKALGLQKSGANARLFLALMAPALTDPEFYASWNAVAQFRRHIPGELVNITLHQAALTPARKRKSGSWGVLITRLEQVCWTYLSEGGRLSTSPWRPTRNSKPASPGRTAIWWEGAGNSVKASRVSGVYVRSCPKLTPPGTPPMKLDSFR